MPIRGDLPPLARNRVLLQHGETAGWWTYESENPPGHRDSNGHEYPVVTYTLRLPTAAEDYRLTLLASEVEGFVLATALTWGEDAVNAIVYRPGLVPPDSTDIPPASIDKD